MTDTNELRKLQSWLTGVKNNRSWHLDPKALADELDALRSEVDRLKQRLLSAAGDDLCRLSQEEIKAYTSGAVKIPPIDEFLPSCARFHAQIANEAGVLDNCLTLAQLIAENERLTTIIANEARDWSEAHDLLLAATGTVVDEAGQPPLIELVAKLVAENRQLLGALGVLWEGLDEHWTDTNADMVATIGELIFDTKGTDHESST